MKREIGPELMELHSSTQTGAKAKERMVQRKTASIWRLLLESGMTFNALSIVVDMFAKSTWITNKTKIWLFSPCYYSWWCSCGALIYFEVRTWLGRTCSRVVHDAHVFWDRAIFRNFVPKSAPLVFGVLAGGNCVGANYIGGSWRWQMAVSYTHLTLPTTPYV